MIFDIRWRNDFEFYICLFQNIGSSGRRRSQDNFSHRFVLAFFDNSIRKNGNRKLILLLRRTIISCCSCINCITSYVKSLFQVHHITIHACVIIHSAHHFSGSTIDSTLSWLSTFSSAYFWPAVGQCNPQHLLPLVSSLNLIVCDPIDEKVC